MVSDWMVGHLAPSSNFRYRRNIQFPLSEKKECAVYAKALATWFATTTVGRSGGIARAAMATALSCFLGRPKFA